MDPAKKDLAKLDKLVGVSPLAKAMITVARRP